MGCFVPKGGRGDLGIICNELHLRSDSQCFLLRDGEL